VSPIFCGLNLPVRTTDEAEETEEGRDMPAAPSIKGSVFSAVVEDVRSLIQRGELQENEITRWLKPEDLGFLDEEILSVGWYDIGSYARMNELLRDVEGEGSNEYLRQCGRRTARRLIEAGLYPQIRYLRDTRLAKASDPNARFVAFGQDLKVLTTISASILNFSRWTSRPDPEAEDRHVIEVSEAQDFPEVLCWRSDGFVNAMATEHGEPDLWRWERKEPDLILFRMLRSL
jgi:hypothetical protein